MDLKSYFPVYKDILKLAGPVILSQVGQVTVSLADNMMVGHAGTTELAAASFANSIFIIGMVFGMGITMGSTPLVGRSFSKKQGMLVASYLKNGFILHVLIAATLVVVMGGVSLFLGKMGQPEEVVKMALPYFLVLVTSMFPLLLFFSGKQFLEGIGNTKRAMQITLIANAVNIGLNYLLIYGKFGFPELGLMGAGWATLISRILMPLMLFRTFNRVPQLKTYLHNAIHSKLERNKLKDLFNIGLPIGTQIVIEVLTFAVGAVMMGWIGKEELAAHQIALGMASATYMVGLGIGTATTIRVSHEHGVHNYAAIRKMVWAALHLVVLFMSSMGILFILFREALPWMFTQDIAVINIAASLLIVAALFQVFDGSQVCLLSVLRGMSDVKAPMFLAFLSYSVIGLPVSYLCAFAFNFGAVGIWMGFLFGLASAAVFFAIRIRKQLRE